MNDKKKKKPACKVCGDIGIIIDKSILKIPTGEKDLEENPLYRDEVKQATRRCPEGCPVNEQKGQKIKTVVSEISKE
jgi:hypothetical protein